MSTTSCPRCDGQVRLPAGISDDAKVRCPLCQAQYTVAEALAGGPPLLEVVEDAEEPHFDEPMSAAAAEPSAAAAADEVALDDLEFPAEEVDDAEAAAAQGDTDVEELSFSTFDEPQPFGADASDTAQADQLEFDEPEPAEAAAEGDDELDLEFGDELSAEASEAETLELGAMPEAESDDIAFEAAEPESAEEKPAELEFGEPAAEAEDEVSFELDDATATGNEATIEFDNSEAPSFEPEEPQPAAESSGLGEFGDVQVAPTGEGEEIPLDIPGEAAVAAVAEDDEEESGGKKKKKKKRKEKKVKATSGQAKGGSALVKLGVPLIVAVPLALYGALWLGYDFVGLGGMLPGFMVPGKSSGPASAYVASYSSPPTAAPAMDGGADENFGAVDPAETEPAPTDPAGGEPDAAMPDEAATPADEAPSLPAPEPTATDEAPAEPETEPSATPGEPDPFAADATPQAAPGESAEPAPADSPFGDPADQPAPAENPFAGDAPSEPMPAEGDTPAADNPFDSPAAPELPAAEPEPAVPAADDPFGTPAAEPEPAADDPFATSPAATPAELPAPSAAEEMPEPAIAAEPVGPRNVQPVSLAEVGQALQSMMTAGQQMAAAETSGDAAGLPKARANFYVALYDMANAMTLGQLGPGADQIDAQLQQMEPMIRQQLAADPKRLESLKLFGARWFAFPKRPNNGVVLAGTVESVDQAGGLFQARIRPAEQGDAVTIVSDKDPQLAAGDEVLTLGSIFENPADQVAGYQGTDPAVVWSGLTLKLEPASP